MPFASTFMKSNIPRNMLYFTIGPVASVVTLNYLITDNEKSHQRMKEREMIINSIS
jgi:hypothetical protein